MIRQLRVISPLQTAIQNELAPPCNDTPLDIRQIYYPGNVDEKRMQTQKLLYQQLYEDLLNFYLGSDSVVLIIILFLLTWFQFNMDEKSKIYFNVQDR
ncbi:hypothetical protein RIR_jg27080.t1 [Rhizophagus irregularis DAOM 181602=DAOM 197198]|nr:hypothetical protein RIR_jg27080.t1 [Rhizophagus irregularis DAOM 181602=DAOM 197198]